MKRMHNDSDSHIHENIFFQGNDKHKQLKKGIKNNFIYISKPYYIVFFFLVPTTN